jgi:hypothetical protein
VLYEHLAGVWVYETDEKEPFVSFSGRLTIRTRQLDCCGVTAFCT